MLTHAMFGTDNYIYCVSGIVLHIQYDHKYLQYLYFNIR